MREEFNPQEWLDKAKADQSRQPSSSITGGQASPPANQAVPSRAGKRPLTPSSSDIAAEVDQVITRIEADFVDITTSYADWVNVGFAFATEFGEAGRTSFHRVSRFYTGYTKSQTDKQYDQCLKSQGHGITIRTFFHMAKEAGVEVGGREGTTRGGDEGVMGRKSDGMMERDEEGVMEGKSDGTRGRGGDGTMAGNSDHCSEGAALGEPFVPSPSRTLTPSSSDAEDAPPEEILPTLPDELFDRLPDFFKRVVSRVDSREERDMLLLGSIVALGSCLTSFSGIYDGNKVYPTLFLYIAAKASSGKGRLVMCRNLVNPVHWEKRKQNQQENQVYEMELKEYNALKGREVGIEKPQKPPVRMHIFPANTTTAGLLQLLADNNGEGLVIETEGDTMTKSLKRDISDFSDFMRKGFHHEMISGYRKTDHEHSEVEEPRFNMILSSTMGQLKELIPSTENGLSSRFMFYYMNLKPIWKNVFAHSKNRSLNQHFSELGMEFNNFYRTLKANDPIEFCLTDAQQVLFNSFFAQMQDKYLVLHGLDYMAIVRRLGLIAFRMMMILTAMRIPESGDYSVKQECGEEDFDTSLSIIKVLVRHASYIVAQMPREVTTAIRGNKKEKFYEGLPAEFTYKEWLEIAVSRSVPERTARRYIAEFCTKGLITKDDQGVFTNNALKKDNHEKT